MVCFPLFVDLNDKTALVVGGGYYLISHGKKQ